MGSDIKINQSAFSLSRAPRGGQGVGRKPSFEGHGLVKKSSFTIPEDTLRAMKVLAAETGMQLNELYQEAFVDLLAKYGKG